MPPFWTFASAGQIHFGPGSVRKLAEVTQRLAARRVLVVTDRNLDRPEVLGRVQEQLDAAGLDTEVFLGGEPEPSVAVAETAIALARSLRPDVIVGLGGGSNIDVAKVTAIGLRHPGRPADWFGQDRVPGPTVPVLAVPTTAGTGSEVSSSAVLSDPDTETKQSTLSHFLRPAVAIIDPELTLTCPRKPTADSGIDALVHAIEALTNRTNAELAATEAGVQVYQGSFGFCDAIALRAIELVGRWLRRAVEDGSDLEARTGMAEAALLGGLAFSNAGVGIVHALEYPIGSATHCSHGEGNGLLLPHVMRINRPARTEQFAQIAQLLGQQTAMQPIEELADRAIVEVERLLVDLGIRQRLRDLGLDRARLPDMAGKSAKIERLLRLNPVPIGYDGLLGILEAAW
jgi:alcohol dehydrogenase class IV